MNQWERVEHALNGTPGDRPPVCFWRHFGMQEPEETVRLHVQFYRDSGMDILKMMCDEFFTYPMGEAATPQEYARMQPQGPDSHYVQGQIQRATQINEALKGEAPTLYNAFSPYATLKHTLGDEESMALLRDHEEAALHLLEIICQDTCAIVEGILRQSGTMGMMLPLQGAEEGRFTREEYMRLIAPTERRVIEYAQRWSRRNLLHMCGWDGIPNHLEWWEGYRTAMVNWDVDVEGVSLSQGRERFPGQVLLGGFNNRPGTLLHKGSGLAIRQKARELALEAGSGRLIIGADCSLPMDMDPVRIRWVIEGLETL